MEDPPFRHHTSPLETPHSEKLIMKSEFFLSLFPSHHHHVEKVIQGNIFIAQNVFLFFARPVRYLIWKTQAAKINLLEDYFPAKIAAPSSELEVGRQKAGFCLRK